MHPRYLDRQALVACWREALLAQAVLAGATAGYTKHPQLERFRDQADPVSSIGVYLRGIAAEADERGYRFDRARIRSAAPAALIDLTEGQLAREWEHLLGKLAVRTPDAHARLQSIALPDAHPSFRVVPGDVASWERAGPSPR